MDLSNKTIITDFDIKSAVIIVKTANVSILTSL